MTGMSNAQMDLMKNMTCAHPVPEPLATASQVIYDWRHIPASTDTRDSLYVQSHAITRMTCV